MLDITKEDAESCQTIINYLCIKPQLPVYPHTLNGNIFWGVTEQQCFRWFNILQQHFSEYISYNTNGNSIYILNNGKTCSKSPDGFLKWYEQWKEEQQLKIINNANLWYNTENARLAYEDYPDIKQKAKSSRRWAIAAVIISLLALLKEMIIEIIKKKP